MKKALFVLFAVLLASFLASCDLFQLPPTTEKAPPDFMEDGRQMVSLSINVVDKGTNRALVAADARNIANYYEVVFRNPDTTGAPNYYYVKNFNASDTQANRTITIPVGDYTGDARAVIFAGKDDGTDKILLGIGNITQVDGIELASRNDGHANEAYIHSGAHNITFTITELTGGASATQSSSTFKILGPAEYVTGNVGDNPRIEVSDVTYPIFPIPPKGTTNADDSFTNIGGNMIGEYTVNLTAHSAAVKISGNWTVTAAPFSGGPATYTTGGTAASAMTVTGAGVTCTAEGTTPGSELSIAANVCTFRFMINDLTAVTGNGLCQVLIDAPVKALAPPATAIYNDGAGGTPTLWHIRGGIVKNGYDGASSGINHGALIILDVGYSSP